MRSQARAIASTMTAAAGIAAVLLVIGLPAAYFTFGYQYSIGTLDAEAEVGARLVGQLVVVNPTMWTFEQVRLGELLERRPAERIPEVRRVIDRTGAIVAESADALPPPLVVRRHPIYDAGAEVAQLEVARSLRPLLLETGLALAASLLVAALVFAALRVIPLRAVERAYAALEESESRFRALYDSMGEGMALHRVVPDDRGRPVSFSVVDVNPSGARMLGMDAAQLVGADVGSLLEGALAPHLPDLLRVADTGEACTFEVAVPGERTLRVSVFSPRPAHVATLLEDVTARVRAEVTQRQLQEQLLHAQKMESVGRLAGGVAHDFNNIMTVILSFARGLAEDLDGELRQSAREIVLAGQRGSALTRQLLTFSRRQVLHPEVLRVDAVVTNLARMIGRLIGEDVTLSVELAPDVGRIRMDPTLLEQALVNLALNARDAMPQGGRLVIAARNVDVVAGDEAASGLPPGPFVALSVRDTGTGMDATTRSRLFEPFFTTKPKGKGTGLGLAIVFGAVEQSGGRISVESSPGAGSTFTIHLPRVTAEAEGKEEAAREAEAVALPAGASAAPSDALPAARVLLVDDQPQVRAAVRRFVVAGGYSVVEAASGDEGLAAFRADPDGIALVLTDLVMPGMGGLALGRAVRALRAVPVLYMSGYSDEIASGSAAVPRERFLQKPFTREDLLERIRAALAG